MTIGLANSAKKSRYSGTITNENQGGGDKKAGFAYQIGRNYMTQIYFTERGVNRPLPQLQQIVFPLANISRPIGRNNNRPYWQIPGTNGGRDGQPGL
jgi:hypothetical protein